MSVKSEAEKEFCNALRDLVECTFDDANMPSCSTTPAREPVEKARKSCLHRSGDDDIGRALRKMLRVTFEDDPRPRPDVTKPKLVQEIRNRLTWAYTDEELDEMLAGVETQTPQPASSVSSGFGTMSSGCSTSPNELSSSPDAGQVVPWEKKKKEKRKTKKKYLITKDEMWEQVVWHLEDRIDVIKEENKVSLKDLEDFWCFERDRILFRKKLSIPARDIRKFVLEFAKLRIKELRNEGDELLAHCYKALLKHYDSANGPDFYFLAISMDHADFRRMEIYSLAGMTGLC